MKQIINDLWASFNNHELGASARKLTAFALMILVVYIHLKYVDVSNCIDALIIDLCGVSLMLGLVTFSQLINLKNGGNDETNK